MPTTSEHQNSHQKTPETTTLPEAMLRWLVGIATACAIALMAHGLTSRPTGYLHSWNQISALTLVRQLFEDPTSLLSPTGAIARVTTPISPGSSLDTRFLNYQEFPLYHLIAALVAALGLTIETSSRIVSILFWGLQWLALSRLTRSRPLVERRCLHVLYLASFSLTYYGQAIMSDIAMAATGAWAIERAMAWRTSRESLSLISALLFVTLSSLFKSYGLIFALPVAALVLPTLSEGRQRARFFALIALCALPVLSWHTYAALQDGYHETSSHAIGAKLATLANSTFYRSLWRDYTHIVGIIPGVAAIFLIAWRLRGSRSLDRPLWLGPWLLALIPYALLTLDKLTDHEYYLLPFASPLIALIAITLAPLVAKARSPLTASFVVALTIIQLVIAGRSVLKAQRENPDVLACAEITRRATTPGDIVAFHSDIARFNSLAHYAERRGYHVEQFHFAPERYRDEGAKFLVIALAPAEQERARAWLRRTPLANPRPIASSTDAVDFRGKPRACEVYDLSAPGARR